MSSSSPRRLSAVNLPRMVLWLASIVVAVCGYLLMTTSNSKQAAIYASGKADYPKLFADQSGATIGGLLIAVGVLGALLALTSLAVAWRAPSAPAVAVLDAPAPDSVDFVGDDLASSTVPDSASVVPGTASVVSSTTSVVPESAGSTVPDTAGGPGSAPVR